MNINQKINSVTYYSFIRNIKLIIICQLTKVYSSNPILLFVLGIKVMGVENEAIEVFISNKKYENKSFGYFYLMTLF